MKGLLRRAFLLGLMAGISAQEGDTLRIMPVGNSITEGSLGAAGYTCGNYRVRLWSMLRDSLGRPFDFVGCSRTNLCGAGSGHNGYGGNKIRDIMARLCLPGCRPDMALVHAGANDIYYRDPSKLDSIVLDLDTLIARIHDYNPGCRILLAGHIPWHDSVRTWNATTRKYNRRIFKLCVERFRAGWPVYFVDHYEPFKRNGNGVVLQADWIHPNDSGYHVMARTWHPFVAADTIRFDLDCPMAPGDTTFLPASGASARYTGASDTAIISVERRPGVAADTFQVDFSQTGNGETALFIPGTGDILFQPRGDAPARPVADAVRNAQGWFIPSAEAGRYLVVPPAAAVARAGQGIAPIRISGKSVELIDINGTVVRKRGENLPSGIYFVRIRTAAGVRHGRILLIR